jgi:hypothetical protein
MNRDRFIILDLLDCNNHSYPRKKDTDADTCPLPYAALKPMLAERELLHLAKNQRGHADLSRIHAINKAPFSVLT